MIRLPKWLRKKPEPADEPNMWRVNDIWGAVLCEAWKPDLNTIAYLLTVTPAGRC